MSKSFDLTSLSEERLEQFRHQTDQLADQVVSKIIETGQQEHISRIFMLLVQNESITNDTFSSLGPELSEILNGYFEVSGQLPAWADSAKLKKGEEVFSLYGPEIFMLLNMASLPLCYSCGKGAKVLYDTGRLLSRGKDVDPLARRLMETAQMVVNVLSEGGMLPSGKGILTLQKVRLIHASIRHYLKAGEYQHEAWEVTTYGEPINQEDLAGTLMSFGPVIISGLKQLNVELTNDQIDAYMHCWKVVGHLMGIDPMLLPDRFEDGFELASKILAHQAEESEAGQALTASCIRFVNSMVPGNAFDEIPGFFMGFFLKEYSQASGKNLSHCIGLSQKEDMKDRIILSVTKFVIGQISHLEGRGLVKAISEKFNRLLLQGIIHHYNDDKQVHFSIPPSLQKNWGLQDTWSDYLAVSPNILGNRLVWQKETIKSNNLSYGNYQRT